MLLSSYEDHRFSFRISRVDHSRQGAGFQTETLPISPGVCLLEYELTAKLQGFETSTTSNLRLGENQTLQFLITLQLGRPRGNVILIGY